VSLAYLPQGEEEGALAWLATREHSTTHCFHLDALHQGLLGHLEEVGWDAIGEGPSVRSCWAVGTNPGA